MSVENQQPRKKRHHCLTSPTGAAGAAALFGLITGTLSGGLAFGIVIAVIFGIQAAISAAFGRNANSTESGGTPRSSPSGQDTQT
jgi:predicted lipid-binding transport protein (Tim44 family)